MFNWKKAYWLATFETKRSLKGIISLFFLLIFFLFFFVFTAHLQHSLFPYDILFLIAFGAAAVWSKPKEFQYQKLGEELWASPYFIMLHQLAVPKDILIKSRFINYYLFSIPFHILLLALLYIFSEPMRDFLTVGEYLSFSLIWICFGIYSGSLYPASDTGDVISNVKLVVYGIVLVFSGILVVIGIRYFSGHGIVFWTMMAARNWPVLSGGLSIVLAIAGVKYWLHYAAKNMKRIDYLI
ncbi:hypothetical protein DCC39_15890 [Pueribacillus theae]|uniref:Permease n=1 Tax=Pueribacillus theae TaxID=2171751 RepID=A0A2U1JSK8_9BACI|nr:hypothetical protein [Pueribacillus theae]PWA07924.1 hypothetical protein DCC39_15890 [Pueribacillus theae]